MGTVELTCRGVSTKAVDVRSCGANRVGDDQDVGLGGVLSGGLGEVANDGGVGVEEVVTGHAGLAGDTSGDDNDLSALEGLGEAGGSGIVAGDLLWLGGVCDGVGGPTYHALGVDVANVGSDTCSAVSLRSMVDADSNWRTGGEADVVEGELANTRVELEEERERLANTTGGTEDGDLGGLQSPCQYMCSQWHPLRCPLSSKKLVGNLGAAESAYLAGRRRESAALGLGESVPGSEHDECDGYQTKMNWADADG
jgi:hypothetical protein